MANEQGFAAGDYLVFQIESGYGLMRVLDIEEREGRVVWHVSVYREMFLDIEMAERMINEPGSLSIEIPHAALTDRAFESTQVSRLANSPLTPEDLSRYEIWKSTPGAEISDRSIRLALGLR